jgi:uncharacterized protein (DUF4415 family)
MAKRRSGSSAQESRVVKNAKRTLTDKIDFSDIPESTSEELGKARRVGRPSTGNSKQLIAIRISPEILRKLKKLAAKADKPYQTLINELLAKATKNVA